LLGIARRKVGTVVRCPTCAGQVVVPPADVPDPPAPVGPAPREATARGGATGRSPQQPAPPDQPEPSPPVFERNDFDDLLNAAGVDDGPSILAPDPKAAPAAPPPAGAWGTHGEPQFDVERLDPHAGLAGAAPPPAGLVLSPAKATVLTVLVVVGLALAFGAGLLVGYLTWHP
jgi:hypothetical protein